MRNLLSDIYFNTDKGRGDIGSPWNNALDALDFSEYRYRYFTLKNSPTREKSEEEKNLKDKFGHSANKTYEEVQDEIKKLVDSFIAKHEEKFGINIYRPIIQQLEKEKEEIIKTEIKLFDSIVEQYYGVQNSSQDDSIYKSMVVNSEEDSGSNILQNQKGILKIEDLRKMSSIEFWTRVSNNSFSINEGQLSGQINLSRTDFSKFAFGCIIQSLDIYDKLKSSRAQSIFSRHLAINNTKITKNLDEYNSEQALRILEKSFSEWLIQFNSGENSLSAEVGREISKTFYDTMSNWFDIKTGKRSKKITMTYKNNRVLAETASRTLRTNLQNTLDRLATDSKYKNLVPDRIELTNSSDKVFFRVSLNQGMTGSGLENGDFYSTITNLFLNDTGINLRQRKDLNSFFENNYDAKRKLINYFFEVLKEGIDLLSNNKELNLLSLGTLRIENLINNLVDKNVCPTVKDFYIAAKEACGSYDQINYLFNKPDLINTAYKSFNVANANSFLSGLLGEIAGLYGINNMTGVIGQMTGTNVFSSIKGHSSYGQSVNDIKAKYEYKQNKKRKQITVGANIKHYVASKNEIEIYSSGRGLSVFKSNIGKYVGYSDTRVLRFMLENAHYFEKHGTDVMQEIGERVAYKHVSEFYRVYDHEKHSVKNLFYILNNVCYPASYIYYCIIKRLQEQKADKAMKPLLTFKITGHPQESSYQYLDYNTAYQHYRDRDWKLGPEQHGTVDGSIKTNGLKINLVKLNLF